MSHKPDDFEDDFDDRPSKSERKRNAHDAQELGEELVRLKELDLKAFGLPETAVRRHRRSPAHHQPPGDGPPAPVHRQAACGASTWSPSAERWPPAGSWPPQETLRFKRVEHWRDRLIAEGAPALDELMQRSARHGSRRVARGGSPAALGREEQLWARAGPHPGTCSGTCEHCWIGQSRCLTVTQALACGCTNDSEPPPK